MVEPITRKGLVYTPLFRTFASYGDGNSSYYYLHRESGKGYRIRFDGREFHELFLGMRTMDRPVVIGGFEIVQYIQEHKGHFPFFSPRIGLDLVETFDRPATLLFPCGLISWMHEPIVLSDHVAALDKERIVLKEPVYKHLQFHYSHALVEMYDAYNPLDYL